jgi:peptide/nickel transport system permease protein
MTVQAVSAPPDLARGTRARRGPGLPLIAFLVLLAVILIGPFFLPSPIEQNLDNILAPPSLSNPLGTDQLGRDELSRVVSGMRLDLVVSVVALVVPVLVGSLLGAAAGWYSGKVDGTVGVLADTVQAFPYYLFVIVLAFFLGAGVVSILVAVAVVAWVSYMRIVRAAVQSALQQDYVRAAIGAGYSDWRILWRHVLPNVFKAPLTYAITDVVVVIVSTATLSYLGVGFPPPTPELGAMVADGQQFMGIRPLLTIAPGLAVVIIGASLAVLGNSMTRRSETS